LSVGIGGWGTKEEVTRRVGASGVFGIEGGRGSGAFGGSSRVETASLSL
jgi:hypothetical protein